MKVSAYIAPFCALASILCIQACNILETRDPEQPEGRNSFLPPTSSDVVIFNLLNAIREKNVDNYAANFLNPETDTALGAPLDIQYNFEPSAEAALRFAVIFDRWDVRSERQYFQALVSSVPDQEQSEILLSNNDFEQTSFPDSVFYIADYLYIPKHVSAAVPDTFAGKMRLTLFRLPSGFWKISNWFDDRLRCDTCVHETWSALKAQFSN